MHRATRRKRIVSVPSAMLSMLGFVVLYRRLRAGRNERKTTSPTGLCAGMESVGKMARGSRCLPRSPLTMSPSATDESTSTKSLQGWQFTTSSGRLWQWGVVRAQLHPVPENIFVLFVLPKKQPSRPKAQLLGKFLSSY